MKISVTAQDIALGLRGNSRACPVALALTRETGLYAVVGSSQALMFEDESHAISGSLTPAGEAAALKSWDLPPEAARKIRCYDIFGTMTPFEFEL